MTDDLQSAIAIVADALEACGIDFMIVGSIAALAHGRAASSWRARRRYRAYVERWIDALGLADMWRLVSEAKATRPATGSGMLGGHRAIHAQRDACGPLDRARAN